MKTPLQRMTSLLVTLAVIYASLLAFMYVMQRRLMYLPDRVIAAAEEYGLAAFEDVTVTAEDGVAIQLWHRPAAAGFPTVVYLHGNAAHIGNRAGILAALADKGFGVLGVSYRGYGRSEGSPSEEGLYRDARAAMRFLTGTHGLPPGRVLLYGESLGTGVASQAATEFEIGALVLQAPYTSVVNRAAEIYFYLPVRMLIKDRFDSLSRIGRVKAPVLIFHGERDTVIPAAHGKTLLDAVTAPKKAFFFPHGGHNDFDSEMISAHVLDFAKEHGLIHAPR